MPNICAAHVREKISVPCEIFTNKVLGTRKYQSKNCQYFHAQMEGTFQALCSKKENNLLNPD